MLAMMTPTRSTTVAATAIEPCPFVAPTAIAVGGGVRHSSSGNRALDLTRIVLAEGESARRAGRWLSAANYLNLAVCLWLFFVAIELIYPAPWPLVELGMAIWFVFDFVPVALVFAGAQRLKRLKCVGFAWTGAASMLYLGIQRVGLALLLATIATRCGVPMSTLLAGGLAVTLVNCLAFFVVLRVLLRSDLRRAFR